MNAATGIQRTQIAPKPGPQVDSIYVDNKAEGYFGVVRRKIDQDTTVYALPFQSVQTLAASATLTAEQNGQTVVLDSGDPIVVTLPDAKVGLRFRFIVLQADNAHALSPQASDGIAAKGLTAVVNKDLVNSTSAIYDCVELVGLSDSLWHAEITGTWTKEA